MLHACMLACNIDANVGCAAGGPQSEVRANMFVDAPAGASQLAAVYTFKPETVVPMSIEAGSKVRAPLPGWNKPM
jgi:hypothetical protein